MDVASTYTFSKLIQLGLKIIMALGITAKLNPQEACVKNGAKFDYIIVGAGSAGSVIANRLTEDNDTTVLLIEAGDDAPLETKLPGLLLYYKGSYFDWKYATEENGYTEQCHKNNVFQLGLGKVLGGSSSINYMNYVRGNRYDYHRWAVAANDSSWEWQDVLKYFRKSESLRDRGILNSPNKVFHGTKGYLGVTRDNRQPIKKYLNIFKELGYNTPEDINGNTSTGYTNALFTIANGVRQSTVFTYLRAAKDRSNLYIIKNTMVTKLLTNGQKSVVGVQAITQNNKTVTYMATREVIVTAGAINTPKLLMLSGIGPRKHLKSKSINVIVDLPVGENYQDHAAILLVHKTRHLPKCSKPTDLHYFPNPAFVGFVALNKSNQVVDYETINVISDARVLLEYCTVGYMYDDEICNNLYKNIKGREVLITFLLNLNQNSRGKVLLKSVDPRDPPLIFDGIYTDRIDLERHVNYMKDFIRLGKSKYLTKVNGSLVDPMKSRCGMYKSGSTEYWRCYARCMMSPFGHYCGTCAMGSVVDNRLRVYGIRRLRVADASIMPFITSGATGVPTVMLAEKAADMIKEDNA